MTSAGSGCSRQHWKEQNTARRGLMQSTPSAILAASVGFKKSGFYHDGRFAALPDVVQHYNTQFKLNLSDEQKKDLIEYLKGI